MKNIVNKVIYTHNSYVQVRYAETDQMGVVHHANYPIYLELARLEWLESLGFSYKRMEESGIMLPVYDLKFTFKNPAYFDDRLRVETILSKMPKASIVFDYNIYDQNDKLVTLAQSTLVFVDVKNRRPVRCPQAILKKLGELV